VDEALKRKAATAAMALIAPWAAAQQADTEPERRVIAARLAELIAAVGAPCVQLHLRRDEEGFPGMERDWTPASFRVRLDAATDPDGRLARIFALGERHGLYERVGAGTPPEYGLTWKGFATSDGGGCFYTGGQEATVTVQSINSYGAHESVVASARPTRLEPWAQDPEFEALFPAYSTNIGYYGRSTWSLERTMSGVRLPPPPAAGNPETFGVPLIVRLLGARPRRGPSDAEIVRLAGDLTEPRIRAAAQAFAAEPGRNRMCISLSNLGDMNVSREQPEVWFFDRERSADDVSRVRRDYEQMRRLAALGIVEAQRVERGLRFALTERGREIAAADDPTCIVVGEHRVVGVLRFEQLNERRLVPSFVARARVEVHLGREPLVAAFPNLQRLANVGGGAVGHISYVDGRGLVALGVRFENPQFYVDPATVIDPPVR
jgi:hypothetical protein